MLVQHSKHSLTKHMSYYIRITEISRSFFKFLNHFSVAHYSSYSYSDQNNEQHIKKNGDNTLLLLNTSP